MFRHQDIPAALYYVALVGVSEEDDFLEILQVTCPTGCKTDTVLLPFCQVKFKLEL